MKAIYGRQSLFKKDSLSIEQQLSSCVSLCEQNGWNDYKLYSDAGYSGKTLNRPGFRDLMHDVKSGLVDKIVCYKFDRISRNISDFCTLLEELQKHHCEFVSISENFDTTSPIGRAMVYICMVFAQMERENISQRVHDNYYYRTELGFWGGGPAPYGYKLDRIKYKGKMHSVLIPDTEQANIVRSVYEKYLEPSGSVTSILTELNEALHIPSPNGTKWTSRVLADILSRTLYAPNDMAMYDYLTGIGATIANAPAEFDGKSSVDLYGLKGEGSKHKRCRSPGNMYCNVSSHDALVDSDTWIRVQHKHRAMVAVPSRAGTGKNSYFTGLMVCESCGTRVSYTNSRGTMGYYICSSKKNRGWTSCEAKPHPKKTTDPAIIEAIIAHYSNPDVIAKITAAKLNPPKKMSIVEQQKKNTILAELADIDSKIDNLMESIASGNKVLGAYANEKIEDLDSKKKTLAIKIQELDEEKSEDLSNEETLFRICDILNEIPDILRNGEFEEIRDLCKLLVQEIVFEKNGNIAVKCTI